MITKMTKLQSQTKSPARCRIRPRCTRRSCLGLPASRSQPPSASQPSGRAARLNITGYVIDAEIDTATHHLAAKTAGHLYRAREP